MHLIPLLPGVIFSSDVFLSRSAILAPVASPQRRETSGDRPIEASGDAPDAVDAQRGLF